MCNACKYKVFETFNVLIGWTRAAEEIESDLLVASRN